MYCFFVYYTWHLKPQDHTVVSKPHSPKKIHRCELTLGWMLIYFYGGLWMSEQWWLKAAWRMQLQLLYHFGLGCDLWPSEQNFEFGHLPNLIIFKYNLTFLNDFLMLGHSVQGPKLPVTWDNRKISAKTTWPVTHDGRIDWNGTVVLISNFEQGHEFHKSEWQQNKAVPSLPMTHFFLWLEHWKFNKKWVRDCHNPDHHLRPH